MMTTNPYETTGKTGLGGLWAWGETRAADAIVTARHGGRRWLLMVERGDGHGWAVPGGCVDPGESDAAAAVRELAEETGLVLPDAGWRVLPTRYVPDPRATDHAWMVTTPAVADLGALDELPAVVGADDADRAAWVPADSYAALVDALTANGGEVFPAHRAMLADALG